MPSSELPKALISDLHHFTSYTFPLEFPQSHSPEDSEEPSCSESCHAMTLSGIEQRSRLTTQSGRTTVFASRSDLRSLRISYIFNAPPFLTPGVTWHTTEAPPLLTPQGRSPSFHIPQSHSPPFYIPQGHSLPFHIPQSHSPEDSEEPSCSESYCVMTLSEVGRLYFRRLSKPHSLPQLLLRIFISSSFTLRST